MLTRHGHEVLAASQSSRADLVTGEGPVDALKGASVVVDVSDFFSREDAVMNCFTASTRNLLSGEIASGARLLETLDEMRAFGAQLLQYWLPVSSRWMCDRRRWLSSWIYGCRRTSVGRMGSVSACAVAEKPSAFPVNARTAEKLTAGCR